MAAGTIDANLLADPGSAKKRDQGAAQQHRDKTGNHPGHQ
jgi:ABC-type nitrate/sulfonate/bicarbonate transport system substrate-binding protein